MNNSFYNDFAVRFAATTLISLVESFNIETPKTKEIKQIVTNLKVNDRKILFVLPENNNNIYLSSRNLQNIKVISVNELNTYDVLNATSLIMVDGVQDILQAQSGRK